MDIQHLVDRLEEVFNGSLRLPMSAYLLVNEDQVFSIVDQLRVTVPEEIKRASRIEAEKDRILAQAHEEADRIRELAKQEASELVRRDSVMATVQQRADNILERGRRDADALRQDADAYVMEVLSRLEEDLVRYLGVVRNGLDKVSTQVPNGEQPASAAPEDAGQSG